MRPLVRSRATLACLLGALSLLEATALAQPAPAKAEAKPESEGRRKEEAREHFQRGLSLFDTEAWDPALAEFKRAHELYPTRAALKNAAQCLRLLRRYDEALDAFEELLALPNLSKDEQELGEREASALRKLVGSVVIADAAAGASIVIDGRPRGTTPAAPLRVAIGTHAVRVSREGFEPFFAQINVAGDESVLVSAHLVRLLAQTTPLSTAVPPPEPTTNLLVPAGITLGLAGVAIGVGAALGALTLGDASAIRAHCTGDVCPTSQMPAAQTATTTATISTVSFVVGGALAVTGVTLLVVRSRSTARSAALLVGPGSILARGGF